MAWQKPGLCDEECRRFWLCRYALIPALYLKGISTGDFTEALEAILGERAIGLSATNIMRLKAGWEEEYKAWCQRGLSAKAYITDGPTQLADSQNRYRNSRSSAFDFPAQHWSHLRTTNPIESTFATVRLRTQRTKGCGSPIATLTMVFKLGLEAQKGWRRLNGSALQPKVVTGVQFFDGEALEQQAA